MASTYAAYYNLSTMSQNYGRRTSSDSESSAKSTVSKMDKVMNFLAPRIPMYPPLTPTNAGRRQRSVEGENAAATSQQHPVRMYDSVLRRPLFQKAKKGNEQTIVERRQSSSVAHSGKSSVSSTADRVYDVRLPGGSYFGMEEK